MRVLLSSIGSRGDVQPILALALELQDMGHKARLCVAPNFKEWIESYGVECIPIGPDLQKLTGGTVTGKPVMPSKEQLQKMADDSIREQFRVLNDAAKDCDVVMGAGALQIALRSLAEVKKIPYVFAAYCPAVLPSSKYPPPKTGGAHPPSLPEAENLKLWQQYEDEFNVRFSRVLNEERAKAGLSPVPSVMPHIFTDRPWLAADPVLAPAFSLPGMEIVQTGAWRLADPTPLPTDLEAFLAAGEPPVYLGFGSMRASEQSGESLVEAARALGLRSILSQGWAGLKPGETGDDCFSLGEANYGKLFPRVRAVVHHGGAGTTHTAALAGRPQVIIPHNYDQFYWAERVKELGVGFSGFTRDELTEEGLVQALQQALKPQVAAQAKSLADRMEWQGSRHAAERLIQKFS